MTSVGLPRSIAARRKQRASIGSEWISFVPSALPLWPGVSFLLAIGIWIHRANGRVFVVESNQLFSLTLRICALLLARNPTAMVAEWRSTGQQCGVCVARETRAERPIDFGSL